jgi:RsmE family RNA methyltransferase
MNLLLLFPEDFFAPGRARISGRRSRHLVEVLRGEPGRPIRVGLLDDLLGTARIIARSAGEIELAVQLDTPPPPPAAITLLLALPRPKALRRVLQGVTACGVKRIVLLNTARVEKSYWQSPWLGREAVEEQLILGLEQARDTIRPVVEQKRLFKPFVEDDLPALANGTLSLVADPGAPASCPRGVDAPVTLAVGPEGGFIPYEIDKLRGCGFQPVRLGQRILSVETVVPALLARLF